MGRSSQLSGETLVSHRWRLQRGKDTLGLLTPLSSFVGDGDWLWILCRFEAGSDYWYYAGLFAEEARLMEINEYGLCKPYMEGISQLGLKLVPVECDDVPIISDIVIHIDKEQAWFHIN